MSNGASQMLISATINFLQAFPPFDRMEPEALEFLAARVKLAYFSKDTEIVSPGTGVVRHSFILQRGKVQSRQAGDVGIMEHSSLILGPGEFFPISSVMAQRSSSNTYVAQEDVFCYEFEADVFFELLQKSPVFNLYCTKYIATLLGQSRQQLQTQFSLRVAEQQTMNSPLSSIITKEPVCVTRESTIQQVVEKMNTIKIGSMIIVDDEHKPVGIFTLSDVLKRIVMPGTSLEKPIVSIMTPDPHTLPLSSTAYEAALAMATYGVRHVLAVDEGGRLKGVVSERDLFALQRVGLRQIRQSIDTANTIEMLTQASRDVHQLSLNMLAQGVGAEQITRFISTLNDTLTRRVLQICSETHDLHDIEWAWLCFGSEGRDEQTFNTDQDNGIVFVSNNKAELEQLRQRLVSFAQDVNEGLDRCGFPLCVGNIMARNPELCLSLEEWEEKFGSWIRTPEPKALLNATIFFDFRPIYGKFNLADHMRLSLLRQTEANPLFLRMLAENALSVAPPLGKIRDFVTDLDPEHPGAIDLKKYGARLFIDGARIFALAYGVSATNTVQRIKLTSQIMNVSQEDMSASIDAFNFIQLMRLRHQYFEESHGRQADNLIQPETLNEVERRILKEAFRQARKVQQRLKLDYQI